MVCPLAANDGTLEQAGALLKQYPLAHLLISRSTTAQVFGQAAAEADTNAVVNCIR